MKEYVKTQEIVDAIVKELSRVSECMYMEDNMEQAAYFNGSSYAYSDMIRIVFKIAAEKK